MRQILVMGKERLTKYLFGPIKNNEMFIKPQGGLWGSTYTPKGLHYSAWHEWCSYNHFSKGTPRQGVIITLKEDTKMYKIDSQEDLIKLIDEVGRVPSRFGIDRAVYVDWEKAAEKYDVIWLTRNGAGETHMPRHKPHFNLYGWDCECYLIMNYDCIATQEYVKLEV